MKRVLVLAIASAVILPFVARAQTTTDFSGTWVLDMVRSFFVSFVVFVTFVVGNAERRTPI